MTLVPEELPPPARRMLNSSLPLTYMNRFGTSILALAGQTRFYSSASRSVTDEWPYSQVLTATPCQCTGQSGRCIRQNSSTIAFPIHYVDAQIRTVQDFQITNGFSRVKCVGLPDAETLHIRVEDPDLQPPPPFEIAAQSCKLTMDCGMRSTSTIDRINDKKTVRTSSF